MVGASKAVIKDKIKTYMREVWNMQWKNSTKYEHARSIMPELNAKLAKD